MESDYDRKFEEMKKYIPFLENMIKRLESTSSPSNPRKAQLDKIRSLRDLLLDKKKRMKMENLLKCEQVLINLYAKVEQRDSLPSQKSNTDTPAKEKADLNLVRNKLKSVVSKLGHENIETLPEIARASETEEVCVPGSKEPALFQRRPNRHSPSPMRPSLNKIIEPSPQTSKRNYTRVLLSPEPSSKRWPNEENDTDVPLYSRRSPKKSPRRYSPSHHRKERKKSSKMKAKNAIPKDLNITLNVPEDSLNSLNTKDIFSRIINCSDTDVDIDTLRELRTQILGELKDTRGNDDISDLILKSYKKKSKKGKKQEEVEEGELSDSESEAIENIYGSLVIMDKDKTSMNKVNKTPDKDNPRKIQICLVINSDNANLVSSNEEITKKSIDITDFESFLAEKNDNSERNEQKSNDSILTSESREPVKSKEVTEDCKEQGDSKSGHMTLKSNELKSEITSQSESGRADVKEDLKEAITTISNDVGVESNSSKPIVEQTKDEDTYVIKGDQNYQQLDHSQETKDITNSDSLDVLNNKKDIEIPLLDTKESTKPEVSEIDILQALKNEILNETSNVLPTDSVTPALHQPKITKVASAQEIGTKKRISIEKYKAKSVNQNLTSQSTQKPLFCNDSLSKEDVSRKQSLKLTEKECERFNFPSKLTLDGSSDEEDKSSLSLDDIYGNLAPKSPDHEDFADTGLRPPVIIPSDPVQTTIVSSDADIDMRKFLPHNYNTKKVPLISPLGEKPKTNIDSNKSGDTSITSLIDPRMKRDFNPSVCSDSPNSYSRSNPSTPQNINSALASPLNANVNLSRNPMMVPIIGPSITNITPGIIPNMGPNMTPSRGPNMTPSRTPNINQNMTSNVRTYEMTPSHPSMDVEEYSNPKHVYAPMFGNMDTRDYKERPRDSQRNVWKNPDKNDHFWEDSDVEWSQGNVDYKSSYPRNERYCFDNNDMPNRKDCPPTPIHNFGRLDCPPTPNPSFGRMDVPVTPVHPFGRAECPSTPNQSFESQNSSNSFVRADPRINRCNDYDNYHGRDDDSERYYQDSNYASGPFKNDHYNRRNNSESYRKYQREQSVGRSDRYKHYDQSNRNYRDHQREISIGRSYNRDYEGNRLYHRNKSGRDSMHHDDRDRRGFSRERSINRGLPPQNKYQRSQTRAPSVGRSYTKEDKMSVQPHTGHSFTIDTSVHSTFQESNIKRESSFDSRRQRAASVGRTLLREPSMGRTLRNESSHETRNMPQRLESTSKKESFRRASSVGREIRDNKSDFESIKADLKSFKYKANFSFSKDRLKETEIKKKVVSPKSHSARSKNECHESHNQSLQGTSKYSPRKNNRDPRVRRENEFSNKDKNRGHDRNNYRNSKNYGIVYSNDNISKGTILGSGYGVKNYKIPKIKRATEETKTNENADNFSKETNNSRQEEKVSEDKKSKRQTNKDSDSDKKDLDNRKKDILVNTKSAPSESLNVKDIKSGVKNDKKINRNLVSPKTEVQSSKCDTLPIDKSLNKTSDSRSLKSKTDVNKLDNMENKQEGKEDQLNDCSSDSSLDNIEKRLTRSARKNMVSEPTLLQISPIKKTKKVKKPLVFESDSDESSNQLAEKNKTPVKLEKSSTNNNKCGKDILPSKTNLKQENKSEDNKTIGNQSNKCLDSSFAIDDLEIFSDNITSDPVIDNINALIADLDNDLDTSKNTETKCHFTEELNLETMMENITCPDKNSAKHDFNKTLCEPDKMHSSNDEKETSKGSESKIVDHHDNSPSDDNDKKSDKVAKMQEKEDESKSLVSNIDSSDNNLSSKSNSVDVKINTSSSILDIDMSSNDAIVSTTEDNNEESNNDGTGDSEANKIQCSLSIPDSTIISRERKNSESQRNVPDSTNESRCEMNSDVSSTHVNDSSSKDGLEPSSSEATTQIESIGKLLTILQDKSKIKELLCLLGDQSEENEKIKKKLEKLSEIVSDDEDSQTELIKPPKKENDDLKSSQTHKQIHVVEENVLTDQLTALDDKKQNQTIEESNDILHPCGILELQEKSGKESSEDGKADGIEESKNSSESQNITAKDELNRNENVNEDECNEKTYDEASKDSDKNESVSEGTCLVNENIKDTDKNKDIEDTENIKDIKDTDNCANVNLEENNSNLQLNKKNVQISNKKAVGTKSTLRKNKKKCVNKTLLARRKRLTRSEVPNVSIDKPVIKKPSRELKQLQEDIREMFIRDDILSATGIRMCRLAKLVDEKKKDEISSNENEPVVVLEKCKDILVAEDNTGEKNKKKMLKGKGKVAETDSSVDSENKLKTLKTCKSGPNSKTKRALQDVDPYNFETDSVQESSNVSDAKHESSSESECDSMSSDKSYGSTELLAEVKKKVKRKRSARGWQAGIIKTKNRKKKLELKNGPESNNTDVDVPNATQSVTIPDFNCFTDKSYCFRKNIVTYDCRLCSYTGTDIVHHYKKQHPHSEIPLSRMSPDLAKEAIKESEEIDFQAISKISSKKYTCRFCFKEFSKKKPVLEGFFWHVVSMHTGEYKQLCSECVNVTRCPFSLDIPPPPKDAKGQLLGYICEKCNFTQISLENLKMHVIERHDNEQTAVYTINLGVMTKKGLSILMKKLESQNASLETETPRVLRSTRSSQSLMESVGSDDRSDITEESFSNLHLTRKSRKKSIEDKSDKSDIKEGITTNIKSKITFENDTADDLTNFNSENIDIKLEPENNEIETDSHINDLPPQCEPTTKPEEISNVEKSNIVDKSNDIFEDPHFKIRYTESGSKEYICCINGIDLHYKTTLLISLKKHVQLRHSEKWDGYCCICKVIVTPQGVHRFKDCLEHFLEKHMDSFPVVEPAASNIIPEHSTAVDSETAPVLPTAKPKIHVRPLSDLISKTPDDPQPPVLPVIESVISLGALTEPPRASPSYPVTENKVVEKQYKYEEVQADIMSKKHRVVLEAMMSQNKLTQVFKCAGRFCSFTTDSAEDALMHASTHMRVGGENALSCAYCDFDASGNAIDLITHIFKKHGCCQYVCGLCFYRAAASQLVNAHIKRVHKNASAITVLRASVLTAPIDEDNMMSRETAVPYYQCCDDNSSDATCKFRTYTPGKFCEHLQIRHSSVNEHICFMCKASESTPADLIRHLKSHGLKLYQCTWCVFGADNETELLEHASEYHPAKLPKAYLRIITNKEGTSEYRVLPLAHLNKSDVPAVDVLSCIVKDNPVREAERSIELEKLIGDTTRMIESMASTSTGCEGNEARVEQNSPIENVSELQEPLLQNMNILSQVETTPQKVATPPPQNEPRPQENLQLTPIIKTESIELTSEKETQSASDVVYCLDSDEESSSQNDNVSADTPSKQIATSALITLPSSQLYVCGKCEVLSKYPSIFKKHIATCFPFSSVKCAHCPMEIDKMEAVAHYNDCHNETLRNICSRCSRKFHSANLLKEHIRVAHGKDLAEDGQVVSKQNNPGTNVATGRRKRSLGSKDKTVEPPEKLKRFGPQDVDRLPINPILDDLVFCSLCEFNTKVRLNMVRHLLLHEQQQPVPQTAPVNPVPHLETNEKHFDKMVNLASSSIVTRAPDKANKSDNNPAVTLLIPPEAAARYPKYVPEKHRLTCGAKGCSYISVDESMLKCHWETLHSGSNDFHCVHCPSYQHLDKSRPLTASRIIAHLKMHDVRLYACSKCTYYHYRRQILEKHLTEVHKGGQVMVVREEICPPSPTSSQTPTIAPTMDLKPWQCGLCKFKSLLRPEVAEHCAKVHNSKMQYKCAYCAFRTSNLENITKHQAKSHVGKPEETFYYYYREGSVPDEPDGTTRWQKQCQKSDPNETKIKSEEPGDTATIPSISSSPKPIPVVDLNIVKKEVVEPIEGTIEDLCKEFGEFCEPNGLKYKCSLCKYVIEDSLEAMQSHLYEELKYRKWGCSICSYKAFHKTGLSEHMKVEHRMNRDPIALQTDHRVETWVMKLLEHQTALIEKNKENLANQKAEILRTNQSTTLLKPQSSPISEASQTNRTPPDTAKKMSKAELKKAFGSFGAPVNLCFRCPKCDTSFKEETAMRNHLENELNKIRWFCSSCSVPFQSYHEGQFHCRNAHSARGRLAEAIRDAAVRNAWIDAVIEVQKLSMNYVPLPSKSTETPVETANEPEASDNSLLVVRYEEKVTTPEEQMARVTPIVATPTTAADSDEDRLVINEPVRKASSKNCPHCAYSTPNGRVLADHVLRHYNLKPYTCPYCGLQGIKKVLENHQRESHPSQPLNVMRTGTPTETPLEFFAKQSSQMDLKLICLVCRTNFAVADIKFHTHDKLKPAFGKKGEVVIKCNTCLTLHKDVSFYMTHHKSEHPEVPVNYVFEKLAAMSPMKSMRYSCTVCNHRFSYLTDFNVHAESKHATTQPYRILSIDAGPSEKATVTGAVINLDDDDEPDNLKRKNPDVDAAPCPKKVAKKSTTKLPLNMAFAKKSTTKLPFNAPDESEEYSFYGTKPSTEDLDKVTTMMPFCNTMVPFTFKKLNDIININPVVLVEKLKGELVFSDFQWS